MSNSEPPEWSPSPPESGSASWSGSQPGGGGNNFGGDQGSGGGQPPKVPDYLVLSILETLFCCLPLGIAAIVYSTRASSNKSVGNYDAALHEAAMAKKMLLIGLAIGVVVLVLYLLLAVVGTLADTSGY